MKTVAVNDDVYKVLIRIKYEKNFKNVSEVIDYLIKRNNAGRWKEKWKYKYQQNTWMHPC